MKKKFCSFYLGERYFGVDILDIREISLQMNIQPIPHAPPKVSGLVNIRGEIHLIIDLGIIFQQPPTQIGPSSRLLIFKSDIGQPFGVLVESVGDIVEIDPDLIEERRKRDSQNSDSERKPSHSITSGVCKLEQELMIVLEARELVRYREATA